MIWNELKSHDVVMTNGYSDHVLLVLTVRRPERKEVPVADVDEILMSVDFFNLKTSSQTTHTRDGRAEIARRYTVLRGQTVLQLSETMEEA